ncbi:MAG: hypothetical protein DYG94_03740 [Leptolyngbya sp. PLA3]|nr:MAG: hypothetical protein EDM82_08800 [Cyanobacteria bacterium CYA]MCE7967841.1 hypothetical protein [Leptolyngbya sp. PL-A3]
MDAMGMLRASGLAMIAGLAASAFGQWTDDAGLNTSVVTSENAQDVSKLAVHSDGSSWHGWFDFQPGGIQVRVERLDADGNQTFGSGGLLVSDHPQNTSTVDWDLRVDASGNCLLAFTDIRAGGDLDVYAYLIAPDGTMLWGGDGVAISSNAEFEADPRIIQLTTGDYVVVWPRFDVLPGLYMQRLNAAGMPQLAAGGVAIYSAGSEEPAFVEIEPTADGQFIASWVRNTSSFSSPRHVYAQKYDASGAKQWGAAPVFVNNATVVPIAHRPRLIVDSAGGAAIAWHDVRDGDFDCYVQRISPAGAVLFTPNGVFASNEAARQQLDPAIAFDPSGDIMMFYRNTDGAQNIQGLNVQRFDGTTGARMLGNGVVLLPYNNQWNGPPRAVSIDAGAAAISDVQPNIGSTHGILTLMRVDSDGAYIDEDGAISVSTADSSKGRLALAGAPGGALIASWADQRSGDYDVYAQRVNADGTLGAGKTPCPPDLTGEGTLDFFDMQAFLQAFSSHDPAADFTGEGTFDFFDVQAFLQAFSAGCP